MLLWFASPERHLLCAQISGVRCTTCGCSDRTAVELFLCCHDFQLRSKHVSDSVVLSLFLVSGDGVILICSSCDPGVPKSQTT